MDTRGRPRFSGVIFDLDGTLLDTIADMGVAMNYALEAHGLPSHPIDAYRYFVGRGVHELLTKCLPHDDARVHDDALRCSIIDTYRSQYRSTMFAHTRPYSGVPAVLSALVRAEIPLSVLSNKPHTPTAALIAHYFPDVPFVDVIGQRDGVPLKPNPATALEIAERMGTPTCEIAFVGDSEVDIETAHNAGMTSVAVTWGFRVREQLLAVKPHVLVQNGAELHQVLAS